jgi:hypothetical protein
LRIIGERLAEGILTRTAIVVVVVVVVFSVFFYV